MKRLNYLALLCACLPLAACNDPAPNPGPAIRKAFAQCQTQLAGMYPLKIVACMQAKGFIFDPRGILPDNYKCGQPDTSQWPEHFLWPEQFPQCYRIDNEP